jgi:MoxR-like ATPase
MAKAKPKSAAESADAVISSSPVAASRLFAPLGLQGLGALEPVLLAALGSEEPLLLIGPHGTGKTLLLTRVAQALGLACRHYNASLLNFDDLVGFPLPAADGSLQYAMTPAAIWGAGAVIFDEISRCRPDMQNKLFPVIHERRVQGLLLDGLRYRWAAMNPPMTEDNPDGYLGSEPLDAALADRFAYVVSVPPWHTLTEVEQLAVINASDGAPTDAACEALRAALAQWQTRLPAVRQLLQPGVARYVRALMALLAQAGLSLSPRRAGMLLRNVLAVHTAAQILSPVAEPSASAWLTLGCSLPQIAEGKALPKQIKLWTAHREAWRIAAVAEDDILSVILLTADPLQRLRLALSAALKRSDASTVVADAYAQLSTGQRNAVVVSLFEQGLAGKLNAAVAGQLAERYQRIVLGAKFAETLHATSSRYAAWQCLKDLLSHLDPALPASHLRANALASSFAVHEIPDAESVKQADRDFMATAKLLRAGAP